MVNLCDQLEPIVKPEWGNVCFHAKFPFVWIYIEMTKKKMPNNSKCDGQL